MIRSILILITVLFILPDLYAEEPIAPMLKEFYIGITKEEVKTIYDKLKTKETAAYINIESETYRDRIMLDNEFGSMSNKIDIMYDESGKANYITFEYKATNILFDAAQITAEALVKKIQKELKIPEMEFQDMGIVKTWSYIYEKENIKLSVDGSKNVRLQLIKK